MKASQVANPPRKWVFPSLKLKIGLPFQKSLLPNIKLRSGDLLGFSLGEQELKLVRISSSLSGAKEVSQLLSLNIRDLPDEEVASGLQTALGDIIKTKGLRVVGVIPAHWVITRNIEIPSRNPKEIREIVNLQASRNTPYSRSEIVIDYLTLGVFKSIYTKILLLIVPRTVVSRYYEIAKKLNLKIEKIVFSPEALSRLLPKHLHLASEKFPQCFVRMDSTVTEFSVISGGVLLYVRSFHIGFQNILMEREAHLARFIEELKRSLEAYQSENIGHNPTLVILEGVTKELGNLDQLIQDALRIPLKMASLNESFTVRPAAKIVKSEPHIFFTDVIAPLLLFEELVIDLTSEENKVRRQVEERSGELVKMGFLAMICLGLVCTIFLSQIYFRKAQLVLLKRRFEPIQREAKELELAYTQIQAVRGYLANQGKSVESLAQLYDMISPDIYLTEIKFEEGEKFSVKGSAVLRPSIFVFTSRMEDSKLFTNVRTKYVTGRKDQAGKEFSDFEIGASFEEAGQ